VQNFRARFHGKIRSGQGARWMPFTGEPCNFYDQPSRLFLMDASRFGVPFQAFHRFVGPSATMRVNVASLVPMMFARLPSALREVEDALPRPHSSPSSSPRSPREMNASRFDWATLLARTFALDALECTRCFGRLRPLAVVTAPGSVATMLEATRRTPAARARPPPAVQLCLPLG
jgi:hypothetical protein